MKTIAISAIAIIALLLISGCSSPTQSKTQAFISQPPSANPSQATIISTRTTPPTALPTSYPTTPKATLSLSGSTSAVCGCSSNLYNCDDFPSSAAAQRCFDYCKTQGKGDVHGLDRDKDGRVCEN